ncbi:protein phosphatase 1 regulatory subunit 26 [Spea bombifrons]|uniref:protein phosphatase 1 regulatory subunit 26 n=1 Tax=Spea bombifrons TaxID=233779 RepID=UPI00234B2DD3|nr:protein phosphatase 1 regulatory subunit 26 [Spea bombifrons]
MFLVNVPPLVAFKTKWTTFADAAAGRLPVCFSESEEEISGTSVTAQVQDIISNLQSDGPSLDVTGEYECIMQKNRKGEIYVERGLKSAGAAFKGHTREAATLVVPAQFKDNKEESSGCGPLLLDSDSDDSVDRDIEEAIQEYLKKKSTLDPLTHTADTSSIPSESPKSSQKDQERRTAPNVCPVKTEPNNSLLERFKPQHKPRSPSPDSVSSDDSFEQSIRDEIEQFLHDKKQQSGGNETGTCKKTAQGETQAKPKLKSTKAPEKAAPKAREPVGKKVPESVGSQSKCIKTGAINRVQSKAGVLKPSENKKSQAQAAAQRMNEDLSDSSSDDGIEEAIQLYQLEKSRLESNLKAALGVPADKGSAVPDTALMYGPDKSVAPDDRVNEEIKRKPQNAQTATFQDVADVNKIANKKVDDRAAQCETAIHATCRAETATELMCAEAILDISKTILPSQPESTFTVYSENPCSRREPESDSSVDSDDSIEQEIRTFLARKAEAEGALAAAASMKQTSSSSSSSSPSSSTGARPEQGNQSTASKNKLSLSRKRKLAENKQGPTAKVNVLEKTSSNVDNRSDVTKHQLTSKTVQDSCMRTAAYVFQRPKLSRPPEARESAGLSVGNVIRSPESPPAFSRVSGKVHFRTKGEYSGDESSSLDSDEDLDTAIKDLLKSKKKCKKRVKDTRSPSQKRVRFGDSAAKPLESFGFEEKDCYGVRSPVIKSCLMNSSAARDASARRAKGNIRAKEDKEAGNHLFSSSGGAVCHPEPAGASDRSGTALSKSEARDSSSVDSDDSIEQEIRKFLAERARESAELSAAQKLAGVSDQSLSVSAVEEQAVAGNAVTKTALQPGAEITGSLMSSLPPSMVPALNDSKQNILPAAQQSHRPGDLVKGASPARRNDCLLVKQECSVSAGNVAMPSERCVQTLPAVVIKTEMNGAQGKSHLPLSGNFVAGLKYISGNDKQLVLNVDNSSPSRLTGGLQKLGQHMIPKQTSCHPLPKKGLLLQKPKVVQAPDLSPKSPLVCPGLYLLTTQVCKENSRPCLPFSSPAPYESGLNLMGMQYCRSQVAPRAAPYAAELPLQQREGAEIREQVMRQAAALVPPGTKTAARDVLGSDSRARSADETALETGSGRNVKESRGSKGSL